MKVTASARLRKSSEFTAVLKNGRMAADKALALYWLPRATGLLRVGFCVGKRLGKAVRRNRIKRLLRESWRGLAVNAKTPADLVFMARSSGVQFSLAEWTAVMRGLLAKGGMISAGSDLG